MKVRIPGALVAVVLIGMAAVAAQSPAADVTFRGLIDAKNIGEYMRVMAARPHHLGSPYGKQNADWILARFKEWGWDAQIESYDVLFPTPKERVLELLGPKPFKATLQEPPVTIDPTSSQMAEQLPSFNAYSVDGDVTGPLVYVNYGRPSDYEELARRGVSVKGAIVIARYGQSWRGIKPDLLRSSRRWVLCGRRVSRWPDAESRRRAARQRDGHADVSR
jgi:N-acetylated-alpha-linked acidic dipeptidase